MQLYNSLSGRKETFTPADPGRPTMYVCGPTVYNHPHIGNARPAVVFDVLYRLLEHRYGDVAYVRNVTDIDDRIMAAAEVEGVATEVIAERYAAAYHEDMAALNVLAPTIETYATGHVPEMIAMIRRLLAGGHAYEAEGHLLFHVPSFPAYGALSRRSRAEMIEGARVEVAPYKRNWQTSCCGSRRPRRSPAGTAPGGAAGPAGTSNARRWSRRISATRSTFTAVASISSFRTTRTRAPRAPARTTAHPSPASGCTTASSTSSARRCRSRSATWCWYAICCARHPARRSATRCLAAHYRKPLEWSAAGLARARHALDRLYLTLSELPGPAAGPRVAHGHHPRPGGATDAPMPDGVLAALEDDLNTPKAFAKLFALSRAANASADDAERRALKGQLLAGGQLLGLLQEDPQTWLKTTGRRVLQPAGFAEPDQFGQPTVVNSAEVERLIELRAAARKAKDFEEADRIRDQLAAKGVILEDQPGRTRWRLAG